MLINEFSTTQKYLMHEGEPDEINLRDKDS